MANFFNVREFGAAGDGRTKDTAAFAAACAAARERGGGTVYVPPGRYVTGSIILGSDMTLLVDAGAVILGSEDPADYPVIENRWEGVDRATHTALISARDAVRVAVVGRGVIDGRGSGWWKLVREGKIQVPRPLLLDFLRCKNLLVEGVTLTNSAAWTLHPYLCENVTVQNVTLHNPPDSPNTDGINPESCRGVHIANCHIDVGDDCITLKAGASEDGTGVHQPCEDITITNCTCVRGHGAVVIGSEMSGGVRNVVISNCIFRGTDRGIRIKTRRGRGGVVEDIRVTNVVMENVGCPVVMHAYYKWGMPQSQYDYVADTSAKPVVPGTPKVRNIHLSNITAKNVTGPALVYLHGLPEMPLRGISIENARLEHSPAPDPAQGRPAMMTGSPKFETGGVFATHVADLRISNTTLSPRGGPGVKAKEAEGVRLESVEMQPLVGERRFVEREVCAACEAAAVL